MATKKPAAKAAPKKAAAKAAAPRKRPTRAELAARKAASEAEAAPELEPAVTGKIPTPGITPEDQGFAVGPKDFHPLERFEGPRTGEVTLPGDLPQAPGKFEPVIVDGKIQPRAHVQAALEG